MIFHMQDMYQLMLYLIICNYTTRRTESCCDWRSQKPMLWYSLPSLSFPNNINMLWKSTILPVNILTVKYLLLESLTVTVNILTVEY